ncbi:MAG: DNA-binding protein [Gemmatimonadetes bacterium]|nr:MAG: DNA-binding protein [Gemmatimonadota bacterium]
MTDQTAAALKLLTEKEAAKILRFSVRTLQKWRTRGAGPRFVHVSQRAVRYRLPDLEDWIEQRLRCSTSDRGEDA